MSLQKIEPYTFIDLFAGIGGFHVAFKETGRAKCVFASEWDPAARRTYRHNFNKGTDKELFQNNDQYFGGDITDQKVKDKIRKFDILCGGFPCQPFSQAGHKRGFKDARGTLFYEIAKIIQKHEPAAVFLENVRGLKSHNRGRTFQRICQILKGLGYFGRDGGSIFSQIVKASDYGLPQHRPRLFMVGFRSPNAADYFAANPPKKVDKLKYTMSDIFGVKGENKVTYYRSNKVRDIGFTLRCGGRGSGVGDRRNWDCYIVGGKEKQIKHKEGLLMQGFVTKGRRGRRYSFPRNVPPTQRMKQLGNSVAVDAIKAWADAIIAALDHGK